MLPSVGSEIELIRAGERQPFAETMLVAIAGSLLVLADPPSGWNVDALTVRWWDDNGEPWDADATLEAVDATGGATVRLLEAPRAAVLRRAGRVMLGRSPAELLTIGGDGRVVRRVQALCLDLSATGCRLSATGHQPGGGDALQVAASTSEVRLVVDARLVWVGQAPFGGWQAGIEFLPHDAAARADLLVWRDTAGS